jgi:hypothetical protein
VAEVFEEMRDLRRSDAIEGERRDVVFREELDVRGFVAALRRAADHFREKEKFVGVEGIRRMAVKVAVENGSQLRDANLVAGFFARFTRSGDGRRLADVSPASGKGPAAVFELTDEKKAVVLEGGDAGINFWRGIADLFQENLFEGILIGFC